MTNPYELPMMEKLMELHPAGSRFELSCELEHSCSQQRCWGVDIIHPDGTRWFTGCYDTAKMALRGALVHGMWREDNEVKWEGIGHVPGLTDVEN